MQDRTPPSRRLAILLSGIWLFISGLFSLVSGPELFFEFDSTGGFLVSWLFVGVMPLGLVWGVAWVVSGYHREQHQVTRLKPEQGEGQLSPHVAPPEEGGAITSLPVLLAKHPACTVVGGAVIIAAVAGGLMPTFSSIEYKKGFGEAFVYALTSPVHAFFGAIGTLIFARIFVTPWQRYWVAYRATLLAQLWTGAVSMFGWALTAVSHTEEVGMTATLLLIFLGVVWVYGRVLKRSDGNPVGLLVGVKILALEGAVTLTLLGMVALLGVALR